MVWVPPSTPIGVEMAPTPPKVAVICEPISLTGRTELPEDAVPLNPKVCQSASTGLPVRSSK